MIKQMLNLIGKNKNPKIDQQDQQKQKKWTVSDELLLGKLEKNAEQSIERTFKIVNIINKKIEENLKLLDGRDLLRDTNKNVERMGKTFLKLGDLEVAEDHAHLYVGFKKAIEEKEAEIKRNTKIIELANKELEKNLINMEYFVDASVLGNLVKEERTEGILKQWSSELNLI